MTDKRVRNDPGDNYNKAKTPGVLMREIDDRFILVVTTTSKQKLIRGAHRRKTPHLAAGGEDGT